MDSAVPEQPLTLQLLLLKLLNAVPWPTGYTGTVPEKQSKKKKNPTQPTRNLLSSGGP